jgi:YihY family inner membrane protein
MPAELCTAKGEPTPKRWVRTRRALREALGNFLHEDSLMVSASMAYHCLLAIFPLLLLVLGVSGIYIRRFELAGRLAVVLQGYLPVKTDFIMQNLVGISRAYGRVGLISFLLLLWSSSGVFLPLENSLNRAWEIEPRRTWWQSRLLALEMALVVCCLIMLSMLLVAGEILFRNWLGRLLAPSLHPLVLFLYHLMAVGGSFAMALLMFVILFERLPYRPLKFRQAFPGAVLTALLWAVARSLFILFLPLFNYRHVYGDIGALVALMTWAYIASALMLFGAQVSRSLYRTLNVSDAAAPTASPAP